MSAPTIPALQARAPGGGAGDAADHRAAGAAAPSPARAAARQPARHRGVVHRRQQRRSRRPRDARRAGERQGRLPIEWRPLLPKDSTSTLTITSAELGAFVYDLQLKALPAGEQKTLHFTVALGDANTPHFRFVNYLRKAETYKRARQRVGDFGQGLGAGSATEARRAPKVAGDVTFEPSKLGERTTRSVSSAEGGEFLCALHGNALKPKPQGPIAIKGGASATSRSRTSSPATPTSPSPPSPPSSRSPSRARRSRARNDAGRRRVQARRRRHKPPPASSRSRRSAPPEPMGLLSQRLELRGKGRTFRIGLDSCQSKND